MVDIQTGVSDNTVGLIERFAEVAATDPLVAAMMLSGAVFVTLAAGVFGVLTLGGVLASVKRLLPTGQGPPQKAR
ncbi:hypothetical protein KY092_11915 [Natronomonas gomsonensis]|jgi:hypothetical protein|uniref:hypothetical protein n=1 Tax=Natronomonas gomsonensis TaxID=1046043 RepID=UPI0020CA745B|nr:hypothetical protein [Natronomonas gomsonensis]MCY4731260.1 hypothetical protein [Natronomonas gomsonensis]